MFNWAKQQLANVAGTQEPIYGPSAIQSVAAQAASKPFTEVSRADHAWLTPNLTCVETQIFYLMSEGGLVGSAQVIYSNVAGLRVTAQFLSKIFYPTSADRPHLWCSTPLSNLEFSEDKTSVYADNCAVELSADGTTYTIKSMTNEACLVNLTIKRTAPACVIGENGTSTFGTDPANPWGSMRHAFWPRATAEGTMVTKDGPVDFKGQALFVHALQGMKPHHAAATWNFANFQTPNWSAVMMEYTTPPSYGSTVVNVGAVAKDGEIVFAGAAHAAEHTASKQDEEVVWPEPSAVKFTWNGATKDGKNAVAVLEGPLGARTDRVDVMAEVPGFVKTIVAAAAGTRPYIYQYIPETPLSLKVKLGDEETSEEGKLFMEATFISET